MKAASILAVLLVVLAILAGASAEYFDFVATKAFVLSMQKVRFSHLFRGFLFSFHKKSHVNVLFFRIRD